MLDASPADATLPLDAASAGAAVLEATSAPATPRPALPRRGRPYVVLSALMWGLVVATVALAIAAWFYAAAQVLVCLTYLGSYWAWAGRHLWMHGTGLSRR